MKNLLFLVIFFSHFYSFQFALAQQTANEKSGVQLSGYILSKDSLKPLANSTVLNKRTKLGTTSSDFGYFKINMEFGDTIKFLSLGYAPKYFYFNKDLLAKNYNIQVLMSQDTIELKTFVFKEPTYQGKLKKEFDRYFTADSLAAFEELSRRATLKNRNILYNAAELYHPVTYFYDRFNKQARNWRKIDRYRYIIQKAQNENFEDVKNTTNDYYAK